MGKCSHCGLRGHNSRTCHGEKGCVKLFGVNIKRSLSKGEVEGYNSDECHHVRERKKGKAWSEEEHGRFLIGLMSKGRGDWRGISRNFVPTRTPTQIASHAQKFFMRRQGSAEKKKRRQSVFDRNLAGFGNTSTSVALKHTVEPQHQNNATLTLETTPANSTMPPAALPAYKTSRFMANQTRPCFPYVPYNNGGIGKLSSYSCAAVHPNPTFPKPSTFPPSTSASKRLDSLELELKLGHTGHQV